MPAAKARAGPKRLPRGHHSRNQARSGGLGRAVRVTGGYPTKRHRKGIRTPVVRASHVNKLRGHVTPARERRIDEIRAPTLAGGGTGERAADRREEVGTLRRESPNRSSMRSSRWSTGVSRMSPKIRTKAAPV